MCVRSLDASTNKAQPKLQLQAVYKVGIDFGCEATATSVVKQEQHTRQPALA